MRVEYNTKRETRAVGGVPYGSVVLKDNILWIISRVRGVPKHVTLVNLEDGQSREVPYEAQVEVLNAKVVVEN